MKKLFGPAVDAVMAKGKALVQDMMSSVKEAGANAKSKLKGAVTNPAVPPPPPSEAVQTAGAVGAAAVAGVAAGAAAGAADSGAESEAEIREQKEPPSQIELGGVSGNLSFLAGVYTRDADGLNNHPLYTRTTTIRVPKPLVDDQPPEPTAEGGPTEPPPVSKQGKANVATGSRPEPDPELEMVEVEETYVRGHGWWCGGRKILRPVGQGSATVSELRSAPPSQHTPPATTSTRGPTFL